MSVTSLISNNPNLARYLDTALVKLSEDNLSQRKELELIVKAGKDAIRKIQRILSDTLRAQSRPLQLD